MSVECSAQYYSICVLYEGVRYLPLLFSSNILSMYIIPECILETEQARISSYKQHEPVAHNYLTTTNRGTRLNAMKSFCLLQLMLLPKRFDNFLPLTEECSEGLDALRFFFTNLCFTSGIFQSTY